jgi:hypothetical protein
MSRFTAGRWDHWPAKNGQQAMRLPRQGRESFGRCGEIVGRASAGLVIVGTAGFALAAMVADLL